MNRVDLEVRRPGDFAWRGKIAGLSGGMAGEAAGDVTLTVRNGKVLGRIMVPGVVYRIVPVAGGGHRMKEIEEMILDEPFETLELDAQPELRKIVREDMMRDKAGETGSGRSARRLPPSPATR